MKNEFKQERKWGIGWKDLFLCVHEAYMWNSRNHELKWQREEVKAFYQTPCLQYLPGLALSGQRRESEVREARREIRSLTIPFHPTLLTQSGHI